MRVKNSRMEVLKMLISSKDLGSQEEVLKALKSEGYTITQATLSRDLKQLKVAYVAVVDVVCYAARISGTGLYHSHVAREVYRPESRRLHHLS